MTMERRVTGLMMANLIVAGIALASFMAIGSIQLLYPFNGMVTDDRTPEFQWSGWSQEYELLIDDDVDFGTPYSYTVKGRTFIPEDELDFGTHWWKVRLGDTESVPRQFTVVSTVALSRPERVIIVNSGNTDLLVHSSGFTGAVTLGVNETMQIGEEDNVKAEQS
jgi:hypothetical protein